MSDEIKNQDDEQVLADVVLNERVVSYPTRNLRVRLVMPTLEIQRKIDALSRARKKILREATDSIPDENAPGGVRIVPAFKSRDALKREYRVLGWWTDEQDVRLEELGTEYSTYLTRLEILGFNSEQEIHTELGENREALMKLVDDPTEEVKQAIFKLTVLMSQPSFEDTRKIAEAATSTEVDDIIAKCEQLRQQYECYVELAKLHVELVKMETEKSQLFGDSWQDQLQYFIRLAQVFHCTSDANSGKPLWPNIEAIEKEKDTAFVGWLFGELQAFWQGLSDEARERMAKYSFTRRPSVGKSSSEESPALPELLTDGDSPEKDSTSSSEVTATVVQ